MKKTFFLVMVMVLSLTAAMAEEYSLQQAVDIALKNNPSIQVSREKITAAQGQMESVRGNLVPQISASGSLVRLNSLIDMKMGQTYYLPVLDGTHVPTGDVVPMSSASITSDKIGNTYSGKLTASWPIYTGGRIWQGFQITRLNLKAAAESYDSAKAAVIFTAKQAYYDLLLAQSALAVTKEAVSSIEKHVERVRALYQNGMVSRYDLLRAEVQLSNLQPQLIRMQNAVDLSRQAFNMALNRKLEAPVTLSDSMEYFTVEIDSASLTAKALDLRPEFRSLVLRQKMVEKAKLISYSSYQPTVALFSDYSYSKGSGFSSSDEWNKNWDLGISASWSLFDGGSGLGKIKEARANSRQLSLVKQQVEDWIRLEVSAGYLTLKASEKTIFSQQLSVGQAEEALKIAKARYESGQATNLDVLDAQLALTQAQTNRIQAVHDYLVSLARLEKAVGAALR
ncbi:TolC family protein [candidate division TA06 bacterium]|nr:TolC family protein [candidate division TA06 bacterium]